MYLRGIIFVVSLIVMCQNLLAQSPVFVPDSVKREINAEIAFIQNEIDVLPKNLKKRVELICYLSKLYNRVGRYDKAEELIGALSKSEFDLAPGEVCLVKAINFKFLLEPAKAKSLFEIAQLKFTIDQNYCLLIETHIELIEYYRKFELFELALKEAENTNLLIQKYNNCDGILAIRYLSRLAAIQNFSPHETCIETSYKCIDSCLKYRDDYYLAISYNEIGFAYQHIFDLDSADYYFRNSEELFMSQGLYADALHVKMNRMRMYANHGVNNNELIPSLLEIEAVAIKSVPGYNLKECFNSIWVESETDQNWEMAFKYHKKFHEVETNRLNKNIEEKIEKVKQQEKESRTKLQNIILTSEITKQKNQLKQTKNTIWFVTLALAILILILFFLFRILRQRNKLTRDLEQRNQQKDELIQEVHHRVKNNLSFVSSLLEMQIGSLPEESKTEELKNASLRIESMSLVHQMLYNQDDIATVDLAVYIPELFSYLKDSLIHENELEIKLNCEPTKVESRTATAFGLIITEFVTNSFKHAFKGVSNPKVEVDLHLTNGNLVLILKDNGVGLKNKKSQKKGFGMRVIDIFSRQINASINFSFENGTQLTVIMKYEN